MSEQVVRYRGAVRDEDGKLLPESTATFTAKAVAPGGGNHRVERGRDGADIDSIIYFDDAPDIRNDDELLVRGRRMRVIVNEWRSPWTGRGGLEVLCVRGQG
jgi:hypothetical protein